MNKKILGWSAATCVLLIPAMAMVFSLGLSSVAHAEAGAHATYDGLYGDSNVCFVKPHSSDNQVRDSYGGGWSNGNAAGAKVSIHDWGSDEQDACNECSGAIIDWQETKFHPHIDAIGIFC